MFKAKKAAAAALACVLVASSTGPGAWQAVAAETTGRAVPAIEPLAVPEVQASDGSPEFGAFASPEPDLALGAAALARLPAVLSTEAQVARPAAAARSAQAARFAGDIARLRALTALSQLPARAAGESSRGAASDDFSRQIGAGGAEHTDSGEVAAPEPAVEPSALPKRTAAATQRRSEPPRARENRSPAMPAAIAGFFTAASAALSGVALFLTHAGPMAASVGAAHAGAAPVAALIAAGALAATAGLFGGLALLDIGFYAYAKSRGKGATAADLKAALQIDVLEGRLDPGVAELVKPDLSGRGLGLAYAMGGLVYLRPELAFTPFLRRIALIHELHHLRQARARDPPKAGNLRALFSNARRDVAARLAEFGSAARLRDVKIPLLERVARQTQNSLRLGRPIDVLVVNPDSPELKDASVYDALSDGNARVEVLETASPQDELGKPERARRFGAVILGKPFSLLPAPGSQDAQKLEATLRQLDGLYLLATRRAPNAQAFQGTEFEKKFFSLSRQGARLDRRDKRSVEGFERQIRDFWKVIATTRLRGMPLTATVENLYGSLENKGKAFLYFGPSDPGVVVWERLLRYWEAAENGQFRVARVDREDGSHMLVLQKAEARVGLWLRPTAGHAIKKSVPDAGASASSRQNARAALIEAGYEEHLKRFDELEIEIKDVFGDDVGRQEIYVTIPRRNAAQIHQFVTRNSMDVEHSDGNFLPHLSDMADLHNVPPVWQLGVTGEDGTVMIIDTSADATHDDFKLADGRSVVEILDIVHEGPEDWVGHGTHTSGIVGSLNKVYRGIARGAAIVMAKVFGKESPGAADGDIMGGGTIGFQRGVDVISMSLGQRGMADSNLADFFSNLTRKKNGKGEYTIVVASAGNAGPFRESASQPAAGRFVRSVGAAVMAPDKPGDKGAEPGWEIPFFSAVGFSLDQRFRIRRVYPFPHGLWKGGDVVTDPGDPNVYKRGVISTKSKDMAPSLSDTQDRKHTGMSGTSMAAPGDAADQVLIKKALRLAGLLEPGSFIAENLPLVTDAIAMRASIDLKLPLQRQGMGVGDGLAAMRVIYGDGVSTLRLRAGRFPGLGWTRPKVAPEFLAWIARYKAVLDLEDKVYEGTEAGKIESPARFDEDDSDDVGGETAAEQKSQGGAAAHQQALARFYEQRKAAVPELLKALKDDVWLVRFQAAFTLFNIMPPGRPRVEDKAEAAAQAKILAELRTDAALALTEAAFHDPDARVRQAAFLALGEIPGRTVDVALQKAAADERWDVGVYGAYALARHGDRGGVARLVKEATRVAEPKEGQYAPDKYARYTATALLGELGENAIVADAELLAAKVADPNERANIRHLAAASLFNIAGDAPGAISDKVIEDLLNASGMDNLALTRTVYRFFPVALQEKAILERLRREPLRTTATVFVLKHKAAVEQPGALGDLVNLLARSLGIPLDIPTPVPDPSGRGVPGVDPALGSIDVLLDLPPSKPVSRYWDDSQPQAEAAALLGAELSAAIGRFEGVVKAVMPLSQAVWVSVPEHKIFAFSVAARKLGLEPRGARPLYTLSAQVDDDSNQIRLDGAFADQADDASLVRVTTKAGASEARALAALERLAAKREALKKPLIVSIEVGAPAVLTDPAQVSPLSRLADRLVLANIGVVAATGNEGPGEKTLGAPADAALPVVVAAAAKESGLQFYSGRAGKDGRAATWADLVDEITLDPDAPENAAIGTAVASRRSAEKLAALASRMAEKGPLPDGWFLYLTSLVRQTLEPMAGRSPEQVGGGLFADAAKAQALLDERLNDVAKAARDSVALHQDARRRIASQAAPGASDGSLWNAVKSESRVTQTSPGASPHAFDFGATRKFLDFLRSNGVNKLAAQPAAAEKPLPALAELKRVLGDGPAGLEPYDWDGARARGTGLEGFLYSKLELESLGREELTRRHLRFYSQYINETIGSLPWTAEAHDEIHALMLSQKSDAEKNAALNEILSRWISRWREQVSTQDRSLWMREAGVYMIFARAFNRIKPGKNFFDSIDDEEFDRIRRETSSNVIWLLDVFEIGEINRWGTGGGSSYALKGYRFKQSLGGEAAYLRFAARAKAKDFEIALDEVPNHASLDSDEMNEIPESFIHIVPPQPVLGETDEAYRKRVLDPIPKDGRDPVFWLLKARNYPDGRGSRAPKWILVHHPSPDSGGLWLDMGQRDYTRKVTRDWEIAQTKRLAEQYGAKLVRRDMSYDDLNTRFWQRWMRFLSNERDRAPDGWVRNSYNQLIVEFNQRHQDIVRTGDKEFLDDALAAAREAEPSFATAEEAYGNFTELSRAGATAVYNKVGLYDALVSRNAQAIREQLKNVAFRAWQRGGATMLNFIGTHDGGEGNPFDKFGKHVRAAAILALMFRPVLVYNGFEQGQGQKENLIGDLAHSVDREKAIPMDIPVLINWANSDPALKAYLGRLLAASRDYADIFKTGAMEVLEPAQAGSAIVGWSAGAAGRAVIGVANVGDREDWARLRLDKGVLARFGSFVPKAGRRYRLTDIANPKADGSPTVYEHDGVELVEKGLFVKLEGGGTHLFEVLEIKPSVAEEVGHVESRGRMASWLGAPWNAWVERMVYLALVPFFLLQGPQILTNIHYLATDPAKVLILPWIGYATGILGNSNLWGYHIEGKRSAVAFVQASGVITSAFVLWQIFKAGLLIPTAASMPAIAAALMAGLIATSIVVNILKWTGRMPAKVFGVDPWETWKGLSKLLGLFAIPLGFSVTFNLLATHPVGVLAASFAFAALGLAAMIKQRLGGLPQGLQGFWSRLGAWLGTLLFVFIPIPQLVNNIHHPERLAGIALGTMLLSTLGNLLEATGAIQHKSQIWFVGSFWSVLVGGWSVLLTMLLFGAVNPLFFAAYTLGVAAWLAVAVRNAKRSHEDATYWKALRFALFGDGA